MWLALLPALIPLFSKILDKAFKGDAEETKVIKAQMEKELALAAATGELKELQQLVNIVASEARSEHKITATWRPILMLTITTIVAFKFLLFPLINMMFGTNADIILPTELFDLLTVGVGGYVVGRSAEKVIQTYRQPKHVDPYQGKLYNAPSFDEYVRGQMNKTEYTIDK